MVRPPAHLAVATALTMAISFGPALPAKAADPPPAQVETRTGTATPALVSGLGEAPRSGSPVAVARSHLRAGRYAIKNVDTDLAPLDVVRDGSDETVRFGQRYRGLPVFGAHYLVRMTKDGAAHKVTEAGGRFLTGLSVATTPKFPELLAVEVARSHMGVRGDIRGGRNLGAASDGLVVVPVGKGVLAWKVTVGGLDTRRRRPLLTDVYVNAVTGAPLFASGRMHAAAEGPVTTTGTTVRGRTVPVNAYLRADGKHELRDRAREMWDGSTGEVVTYDARQRDVFEFLGTIPPATPVSDSDTPVFNGTASEVGAVDAHWGAGQVYEFYRRLGRNGIDGKGGSISSVVNVTLFGGPFVNAFWDGTKMVYGGGGPHYHSLASALDVVGHEMTHGVVEHTAGLVYFGQSGAMNEALADYFGNAIQAEVEGIDLADPDAGLIGETICRTGTPRECGFRDLNDGRTASGDYVGATGRIDGAGVHMNSTIFSGALWDIREKLGATADRIALKALSEYMTPLDDFTDGRRAVLSAARRMRLGDDTLETIEDAFDAHGVKAGWEHRIPTDHDILLRGITDPGAQPSAAGGRYVVTNSPADLSAPPAVYAGRVRGGKAERISEQDGQYASSPATDGRTAVWITYLEAGTTWRFQVWRRPLDRSGPSQLVHEGDQYVLDVAVEGDTVSYAVLDMEAGDSDLWVRKGDAAPVNLTPEPGVSGGAQTMRDGRIAYIKSYSGGSQERTLIATRDLASGRETELPAPQDPSGVPGLVFNPVLTGSHLVWLQDAQQDGRQGIMRAKADGGSPAVLSPDDDAAHSLIDMDATDAAVTYGFFPEVMAPVNDSLPKIAQLPATGGTPAPVTCNRGEHGAFAAAGDTRVVWVDGTAGRADLVTRAEPADDCPSP
ncbi:hypothetical protein GCM10017673_35890 [Streptosporangium violaceochromogenes]|nr:hypothetical protein GCM10017673_35890 [Streptosporangium violaceochromogenes]